MPIGSTELEIMQLGVPGCFGSLVSYAPKTELCQRCKAHKECGARALKTSQTVGGQALLMAKRRGITGEAYQMTLDGLSSYAARHVRPLIEQGVDLRAEIRRKRNPFMRSSKWLREAGYMLIEGTYTRDNMRRALMNSYQMPQTCRRYESIINDIVTAFKLDKPHA